ncbi:type I polyketide synthase [Amycolatopsis sp. NPDC049868]|uniref:type I polyketide synthase n=1 Tax=Amycolatopsis sp. NPDC049868 TaxID=3363934 RepID=UPI0037AED69C
MEDALTHHNNTAKDSDIAIIGMACRFPGSRNVGEFWQNLKDGRDSTTFFTDDELRAAGVTPAQLADPDYVRAGQILPDVEMFDADLFGMTSEEAEILDPQQRHFLECSMEALEDAGYDPGAHPGEIGVYAGAGMNTYLLRNLRDRYHAASSVEHYRLMLANDKDFLSTRVSYKLNLRGPSVNINTACSTSLVAVHLACLSLLGGECRTALAGSVHIKVPQTEGYQFQEGMIFSPDGRCRTFDAKAQGTIIGNGVGIVVLKRLRDAVSDGDSIRAVIKGTAINNDGSGKTGYTAPSVQGQAAAIADAQAVAGTPASTISYVEAHGTGTPLGDPIEVAALTKAFTDHSDASKPPELGYCAIGSVKTNVGHLDTAAGMAGLIKTSLMLQHRAIVPSLHFDTSNPDIDFRSSPFYVNTELVEWPKGDSPRRAGVSAFGIGGTNAHAVLEEPPAHEPSTSSQDAQLLVLSAHTTKALDHLTHDLARYLNQHPQLNLADVAHTLGVGRRAHAHRRALVCRDTKDAALTLALANEDQMSTAQISSQRSGFTLVFPGQLKDSGSGLDLYHRFASFRTAAHRCMQLPASKVESLLSGSDLVAAMLTQYSLATMWLSWGVRPDSVAGHGTGELVAACVAGVFPFKTALAIAEASGTHKSDWLLSLSAPTIPLLSTATGRWMDESEATDPATWSRPHGLITDHDERLSELLHDHMVIVVEPDSGLAPDALLRSVGRAWTRGIEIDWTAFYAGERRRRVPLPTYPFERQRYWVDAVDDPQQSDKEDAAGLRHWVEAAAVGDKADLVVGFIQNEIANVLGTSELPAPDKDLFDLGLDSLILIDITAKLCSNLKRPVPSSSFIEHPTIRGFVDNLADELGLLSNSSAE